MNPADTEAFFSQIDWLMPSLSEAESLRRNGRISDSRKITLKLLRRNLQQAMPELPRLDLCGDLQAQADRLLERRVVLLGKEIQLDDPVDWSKLGETDGQRNWHLGYSYWLNALADTYQRTGDDRYAEQWRVYVEEFLDHCPYASDARGYWPTRPMVHNDKQTCNLGENGGPLQKEAGPESRSQWMSLSCHFRIETWLSNLARLVNSPEIDDAFLSRILSSLINDHAYVCVMNPRENTPNQFTAVTLSLLKLSLLLPECRPCAGYFLIAWERLQRVFSNNLLPDGSDLEQSPDYNCFLLDLSVEALELLKNAPESRAEIIKTAAIKRLRFLVGILAPDGTLPPIGKAHAENKVAHFLKVAHVLEDGLSIQALEQTKGALRNSISFPYGGYYCLRGSEDYLLFKASALGSGHMHEDCLSFILWADGEELLTDPSHYTYNTNTEEEAVLNAYALGTQGHNSVCIDGMGQRRLPLSKSGTRKDDEVPERLACNQTLLPFRACEDDSFSFIEGAYADGFGPAGEIDLQHMRTIMAVKGHGWLVIDQFTGDISGHRSQQHWHLADRFHETEVELIDSRELRTCAKNGVNFRMLRLDSTALDARLRRGEMKPAQGWVFPKYAFKTPSCELIWESALNTQSWHATWIERINNPDTKSITPKTDGDTIHWKAETGADVAFHMSNNSMELKIDGKTLAWEAPAKTSNVSPPTSNGKVIDSINSEIPISNENKS